MEMFSWFLISSLTCHLSLGTFIQKSGSDFGFIKFLQSSGQRTGDPGEGRRLGEGSGLGDVSTASQQLINETGPSEEAEWVRTRPESRIAFTAGLEPSLLRGAHEAWDGSTLSGLSAEVLKDSRHVTAPERFSETQRSRTKDGPEGPCGLGLAACVVLKNLTGTNLLWDDMSRTLAFAWELHVFGCATLFILLGALAAVGLAGACTLPCPLGHALSLANCFLLVGGAARGVPLLLDPYGTHQVLSRSQVVALHNLPLLLLLWTHLVLTLLMLGLKVPMFPAKLRQPPVVGALGVSHCTLLLIMDLHSSSLSPALPLLLQILSLGWSLLFCSGTLLRSFSESQLGRTRRADRQVVVVCAFLGVLCCGLQMNSLLWLYGFLGNWRHFGWGWWLTQFWARILELAWGFFLLVLGSWIFWRPRKDQLRADRWASTADPSKSLWRKVPSGRPLRESEKVWEDLMPRNWSKYNLSRANLSHHQPEVVTSDPQAAALLWQKVGERKCFLSLIEFDLRPPTPIELRQSIEQELHGGQMLSGGGLFSNMDQDLHGTQLPSGGGLFSNMDQDLHGGQLSSGGGLFSSMNQDLPGGLFSNMDQALQGGQLPSGGGPSSNMDQDLPGGLFSKMDQDLHDGQLPSGALPLSWRHAHHTNSSFLTFPPNPVGFLDTDSISVSLDHFQAREQRTLTPDGSPEYCSSLDSQTSLFQGEDWSSILWALMHKHQWGAEDVTDL